MTNIAPKPVISTIKIKTPEYTIPNQNIPLSEISKLYIFIIHNSSSFNDFIDPDFNRLTNNSMFRKLNGAIIEIKINYSYLNILFKNKHIYINIDLSIIPDYIIPNIPAYFNENDYTFPDVITNFIINRAREY